MCACTCAVIRCRLWCSAWTHWSRSQQSLSLPWLPLHCCTATVILQRLWRLSEFQRPPPLPLPQRSSSRWRMPCSTRRVLFRWWWDSCSWWSGDSTRFATVTKLTTWSRLCRSVCSRCMLFDWVNYIYDWVNFIYMYIYEWVNYIGCAIVLTVRSHKSCILYATWSLLFGNEIGQPCVKPATCWLHADVLTFRHHLSHFYMRCRSKVVCDCNRALHRDTELASSPTVPTVSFPITVTIPYLIPTIW